MKSEIECEYPTAKVSTHLAVRFSGLVKSVCTSRLHMKTKAKTHDRAQAPIKVIMTMKKMLRASLYEGTIVKIRRYRRRTLIFTKAAVAVNRMREEYSS